MTLIVYAWRENAPGTLAWVFPSVEAAMGAVRALKNAMKWCIVAGKRAAEAIDLDEARASGLVLCESAA